jgi:hypothetical protein
MDALVFDKGIDFDGVRRPSGCLARLYIPMFGIYIAFHSETRFLTGNGYPAKKRNHPVGFLFVSFQVEKNLECATHTLNF